MELDGWSAEQAREAIVAAVRENLLEVFENAALGTASTHDVALSLVERRLAGG